MSHFGEQRGCAGPRSHRERCRYEPLPFPEGLQTGDGCHSARHFSECRKKRVQTELSRSRTITEAIYDSGFNSNGRFYASSSQMLGMTPKDYRSGGGEQVIRFAVGQCSLGSILVAATDKGLCSILLGDDPDHLLRELQDRFRNARLIGGDKDFERMVATVVGFVENPNQDLNLPLDVQGTAFQQRVWRALRDIPVGATASYEEIAKRIGAPGSARAVAAACSANHWRLRFLVIE